MEKRLLNVKEVQAYTGIGRNNAYLLIRKAGAEVRFGNRLFADKRRLDEFIDRKLQ